MIFLKLLNILILWTEVSNLGNLWTHGLICYNIHIFFMVGGGLILITMAVVSSKMSVHIYQTMCQQSHVQCCTWSTRGCIRASKRSLLTNPWPLSCWNTPYSVCRTYWSNSWADASSYTSPSVPLSCNLQTLVQSNSADAFWTSRPANSTNSPFRLLAILLDSLQNRTATVTAAS